MPSAGNPPLVVLLGASAVGKTALSLELAEALNGEIISADSRLVYRGMTIGVAKPTPAEQARAPHHLIDIVTPDEELSLAQYQKLAYAAINAVHDRGRLPLLVGGTGQYITAVIDGWGIPEVPPNPDLRAELEAFAAEQGAQALHQRLRECDPTAAQRIHPNNVRRVIRALEVYIETGTPITEIQRKQPPPYRTLQIELTRPHDDLYARIDARVDQMMADGLLAEVQALLDAGYDPGLPAMSGLGYAQLCRYLVGKATRAEAVQDIKRETRAFVRRQETWFRKYNQAAHRFDMTETATPTIIHVVRQWLESDPHAANS